MGLFETSLAELGYEFIGERPRHFIELDELGGLQKKLVIRDIKTPKISFLGQYNAKDSCDVSAVKNILNDWGEEGYGVLEIKKGSGWAMIFPCPWGRTNLYYETPPLSKPFSSFILTGHGEAFMDANGEPVYRTYENYSDRGHFHYPNKIRLTLGENKAGPVLIVLSLNDGIISKVDGYKIYTMYSTDKENHLDHRMLISAPEYTGRPYRGNK